MTVLYRIFYRHRDNPDISGEGLPVAGPREAHEICVEANKMFPHMKHEYKRGEIFTFEVEE